MLNKNPTDTERLIALADLMGQMALAQTTEPAFVRIGCAELSPGNVTATLWMPRPIDYAVYYSSDDPKLAKGETAATRDWSVAIQHDSPADALRAVLDSVILRQIERKRRTVARDAMAGTADSTSAVGSCDPHQPATV